MSQRLRVGVAGCGAVAQIMHLPHLREMDDLYELVVEAWLTRAQKRVAKAWLAEQGVAEDPR